MVISPQNCFFNGVVVHLKELTIGRQYTTYQNQLSNPPLSGKELAPREFKINANPRENEKDFEQNELHVGNPEEALMRTRSCRVVEPL